MQRYTFIVRVHPGEVSTVENLATQERASVANLDSVGPQIERWLEDLESTTPGAVPAAQQVEER